MFNRIREKQGFTLIELRVVILIIGILIAVAAPSFIGQQDKAKDSVAKQQLTVAYKTTVAEWTSNGQAFPCATTCLPGDGTLTAALVAAEPSITFVTGTAFISGQVSVERISDNSVKLRTLSASGKAVALVVNPGTETARAGVIGPSPTPTVANGVPNPSFELGTNGWASRGNSVNPGATLTRVGAGAGAPAGRYAMRITTTGGGAEGAQATVPVSISVGAVFTVSVYMKSSSGGERVQISFIGASAGARTVTLTSSWQRYSFAGTVTNADVGAFINITVPTATAQEWFGDGAMITPGGALQNYFDGDFANAIWAGSSHNSVSNGWPGTSW